MNHRLLDEPRARVLTAESDFVLLTSFVDRLPNTVLLQAMRLNAMRPEVLSLYIVYREGSLTFDATLLLDGVPADAPMAEVLQEFLASEECGRRVIGPLAAQVRNHFKR